ncbi:MAG: TonB-dependent receptor, partial [Lewinella sp.]|nr:TonB-dependent receptor [Lewinella sp.]
MSIFAKRKRPFRANWPLFWGLLFTPFFLTGQLSLEGSVHDEAGLPLVGANVYLPDLQRGTTTDDGGAFQLSVPVGVHQVEITYVGFAPYEKEVVASQGMSPLAIILKETPLSTGLILVSATRADARTPMTYANLEREELERNNLGQDVPFLLRWTPSTVVTSDAGAGIGYTGIWIRGSDPTRTNVTINGIPLNDAESQGVFWVDLPDFTSSAEDIQIQRGVGASTNGAGAFGATINLNTSKVYAEPYASISTGLGSFNSRRGTLRFGTGRIKEHFTVDGRISRITSDGYIDRASADLTSWHLSGAWMNAKSSLRLNAFSGHEVTYQAWNGVPAEYVDDPVLRTYNSAGTEKEGEPYDNEVDDYQQTHFQLLFNHQWNDQWYLNLAGHYTLGEGFF